MHLARCHCSALSRLQRCSEGGRDYRYSPRSQPRKPRNGSRRDIFGGKSRARSLRGCLEPRARRYRSTRLPLPRWGLRVIPRDLPCGRGRERVMLNLMRSYARDTVRRCGHIRSALVGRRDDRNERARVDIDFLSVCAPGHASVRVPSAPAPIEIWWIVATEVYVARLHGARVERRIARREIL